MKIPAYPTAAAINLKRLAAALLAIFFFVPSSPVCAGVPALTRGS